MYIGPDPLTEEIPHIPPDKMGVLYIRENKKYALAKTLGFGPEVFPEWFTYGLHRYEAKTVHRSVDKKIKRIEYVAQDHGQEFLLIIINR